MKTCTKCKEEKSEDKYFVKRGKIVAQCKECERIAKRNWARNNQDYAKAYYEKNKKRILVKAAENRKKPIARAKARIRTKKWQEENREYYNEYMRFYHYEWRRGFRRREKS